MTTALKGKRSGETFLRRTVRSVGSTWRRLVPRDGTDDAPPLQLPAEASILILQLQQVGDSLMMAPVVRSVRRRYPRATIELLATRVAYEIYRRCPDVDRIRVVDAPGRDAPVVRRLGYWRALVRELRQTRYDCVLACCNHVSANYVLVAASARARHTVGFDQGPAGFLFTRRLQIPPRSSVLHANLSLAAAIDAPPVGDGADFWYTADDGAAIDALLARVGVDPGERLAILHPASNWQSKTWYPARWAAVADWLCTARGLTPVFVGTARDAETIRAVQESMRGTSCSVAGETDLCELGALIARADLFVGTDSGPRHIAGALGRPQVTVMSSLDDPWRWGLDRSSEVTLRTDPVCRGCLQSHCSHRLCLDLISCEAVIAACRGILDRARTDGLRRVAVSG